VRCDDGRKPLLQDRDDVAGVVHGQRRLRRVGEFAAVARHDGARVLDGFDQLDGAVGQLPHRANYLGMAGMADQDHVEAAFVVQDCFLVHLGDERAGGVEKEQAAMLGIRRHRFRHAVGGKDHRRVGVRNLVELVDEDRTLSPQVLDDEAVVHDLMADIDRGAIAPQSQLDDLDGAVDTGAKSARRA